MIQELSHQVQAIGSNPNTMNPLIFENLLKEVLELKIGSFWIDDNSIWFAQQISETNFRIFSPTDGTGEWRKTIVNLKFKHQKLDIPDKIREIWEACYKENSHERSYIQLIRGNPLPILENFHDIEKDYSDNTGKIRKTKRKLKAYVTITNEQKRISGISCSDFDELIKNLKDRELALLYMNRFCSTLIMHYERLALCTLQQ